jgi:hypothetical protein
MRKNFLKISLLSAVASIALQAETVSDSTNVTTSNAIDITAGWQLIGTGEEAIANMDIFSDESCIHTVWAYNKTTMTWSVFSPNSSLQGLVDTSLLVAPLSDISSYSGFWVKANSNCSIDMPKVSYNCPDCITECPDCTTTTCEQSLIDDTIEPTNALVKTGQVESYADYDDGYYQKGLERSYVRDNHNYITQDMTTGLIWQDGSDVVSKTWEEAVAYCDELEFAGYSDWRLPSFDELNSIVDIGRYDPAIDTNFFKNTKNSYYWTSTMYAVNSNDAWGIAFSNGYYYNDTKSNSRYVRCVR